MARRSDIDWQAVERMYISGQYTIRQIADACGVDPSSVVRKAKQGEWKQDLTDAIRARTKAKVSTIDVNALVEQSAQQSASQSAQTLKKAIEQASDVAAGIVIRHRETTRKNHDRVAAIEAVFDRQVASISDCKDLATAAHTLRDLIEARGKLIAQERQAFGLGDTDKPVDSEEKELSHAERAVRMAALLNAARKRKDAEHAG